LVIKALWYGFFEVLEKVGDNAYKLILAQYMCIYSVVNVKKLKLCEFSMLYKETDWKVLPTREDLAPKDKEKLEEDEIL
jgi:hypothetical protein